MAQLRSCYFCGMTGTLSEYETVPAGFRTEATSRQVVLCDRCHTKLTAVVKPIVDRLDSGAASERDAPGGDQSSDRPARASDPDASRPADDRSVQPEVTFAGTSGAGPADRTLDEPDRSDEPVTGSDATGETEGETARERSTAVDSQDAETADAVDTNGGDGDAVDGTDDAGDEDAAGDEDDAAERSDDAVEGTEPDADDGTDTADVGTGRDDLDRVYYQLLRFLRNREFPIPRPEAETVAQSAYDLTASEASRVIQRAVDREVLDERDGQLHRN